MGPPPESSTAPITIDGISYIPSNVVLTGIPKISFKDDRAFGVLDAKGESPRLYAGASELGFYFNDTRFLEIWEMTFNGEAPLPLAKEVRFSGNTVVFSMTNRDLPQSGGTGRIRRDSLLIRRIISLVGDRIYETVDIKNFDQLSHTLQVEQWTGGRFEDVFEVRGFVRLKRGKVLPTLEEEYNGNRCSTLQYEGLDGQLRRTHIFRLFRAEKIRLSPGIAGYFSRITIAPGETIALKTVVSFNDPFDCSFLGKPYAELSASEQMALLGERHLTNPFAPLEIESDNALINRAITSARKDIFTLLTREENGLLYPYAGIPWFSAPFGRDGLITAYQMLPWNTQLACGVLDYAFQLLGTKDDPFTDEQIGKVFHEMRRGEMSITREVPFIPYYGSVDSTPLALILLHEYIRWTLDLRRLKTWWPSALKALHWIDRAINSDRDGFVGYEKLSPTGLVNQGWKDSHDSVMHNNGKLATSPIRLCEVQGYTFRAKMGMSALAQLLGDSSLAERLRIEALNLRSRFMERFWDSESSYLYLALDGADQPCKVRSSNMGHCLWTQILPREHARKVSKLLMSDAMFSGYGIRTLSDTEKMYNPLSYHNGSVWPHDNSMIMEGFRLYNHRPELENLALALIGVLDSSDDFRLPELYCGFRKRGSEPPVPYEVACKPQAWAAGSVFLMLKSLIGISMDADQSYLVFSSPTLTHKMDHLSIRGLRGRDWELDLSLHRTAHNETVVEVTKKTGSVKVLTVRQQREPLQPEGPNNFPA
ncbi:MAG: hypothetical protein A2Z97_02980 [Bdellovibrionales bacterium GWB1_52_6]|nr:MAG: hypothetical protein A2Z97_02980 [Bdellovibrionales bacterium GWB1_52_6]